MAAGACGLFLWEYFRIVGPEPFTAVRHAEALAEAQTMCVTSITFTQMFYLLNCRSLRAPLLSQRITSNPAILIAIGILLLLQACFIYLPPLQGVFQSAPLDARGWLSTIGVGAVMLPVISLDKWLRNRMSRSRGEGRAEP